MFKRTARPSLVIAFVALFVSLGGGALAAKLIDGQSIKRGTVSLNRLTASAQSQIRKAAQKGAQGATGAPGARGAKGDAGPRGETGATGARGDRGDLGLTGARGAQGEIGLTGARGAQGETGLTGARGAQGEVGLTGERGAQGPVGLTGDRGGDGEQGPTGATGATGPTGPQGDLGPTGPAGDDGEAGPKGDDGDAGPQGEPGPAIGDAKAEYGVAKVYVVSSGEPRLIGTLWTFDIPDDGNNAAQASGTLPITGIVAGDVIEVRGAVRSDEQPADGFGAHMGAALTVTSAAGALLGADQTAPATGGANAGTSTVAVPQLALDAGGPAPDGGAVLARVTVPAGGTVIASGVVQAFDFFD